MKGYKLTVKILIFFSICDFFLNEAQANESYCPAEYTIKYGNKCFKFLKEKFTWDVARRKCKQNPGKKPDLASIHSTQEMAMIVAEIKDFEFDGYWIGLSYDAWDDEWTWSDGSRFDFNYFNGRPTGDAAFIRTHPPPTGQWRGFGGSYAKGALCQTFIDPKNPIVTPPVPTRSDCRYGYKKWLYGCYRLFNVSETWTDAETFCKNEGGHLASIHTDSENAAVFTLSRDLNMNFWIGFRQNEKGEYHWADGWPNDVYTNWDRSVAKPPNCASMNSKGDEASFWKQTNCKTKLPFVCKISNEQIPTVKPRQDGECPPDKSRILRWRKYKSNCYFSPGGSVSFSSGARLCQLESTDRFNVSLASIHTYGEDNFIYKTFQTYHSMWIGLLKKNAQSPFKWIDNSTLQYEAWAPNQKISPESQGEVYIEVTKYPGLWVLATAKTYHRVLCKTHTAPPLNLLTSTTPSISPTVPTIPGKCRTDGNWYAYSDKCYLFTPDQATFWPQANRRCKAMNATLATVKNKQHSVWLAKTNEKLRIFPQQRPFWVGLYKTGFIRDWKWADGTTYDATVSNWAPGYPKDSNCVIVTKQGQWENKVCSDQTMFIKPGYVCQSNKEIDQAASKSSNIHLHDQLKKTLIFFTLLLVLKYTFNCL